MHITQSKRERKHNCHFKRVVKNEEQSRSERIARGEPRGVAVEIVETRARTKNHSERNEETDFEKIKCEGGENGEIWWKR